MKATILLKNIEIINKLGLHARAASKFVMLAQTFKSDIKIEKDGKTVNGKSIMGIMMLAAAKGSTITIHINGQDAESAMQHIENLILNRFDEAE